MIDKFCLPFNLFPFYRDLSNNPIKFLQNEAFNGLLKLQELYVNKEIWENLN